MRSPGGIPASPTRGIGARRAAAVIAGKLTASASRLLGRGGGTALPGLVAVRLDPDLVRDLASQLAGGSVVVTGTNGKTTTCRMLGAILADAGYSTLRNTSGSNLMRGLASSLLEAASITGDLRRRPRALGLFEVDEAALPEVLAAVTPRALLLLDLFRDQLDRYGEVAAVARIWAEAVARLPASTQLAVNADDPLLAQVASAERGRPVLFGIESADRDVEAPEHASDVKACPRCGGQVSYDRIFLGHLGHYRCLECELRRVMPQVRASNVRLYGVTGSEFDLITPAGGASVNLPLPGLYNVYNALGAATIATMLGIDAAQIASSLVSITPAFGRMERVTVGDRAAYLALAKNPAGLNEVMRTVLTDDEPAHLLVMLNDNIADGRDVSWIWDADVEDLRGNVASVIFAGIRAEDMALRFKYAGVLDGHAEPAWEILHDTERALQRACELTPPSGRLFIVPTYTALLDLRATLVRRGYVRPHWEE